MVLNVLIGIVTHNNADVIQETIKSIINHTKELNYKIIIHDNNSKDKTIDIIKFIECDRVDIIASKTNYGFGYGHNRIISKYTPEYCLICNPDIRIKSNVLKELYDYMADNQNIGMVTPMITYPDGQLQYLCKQNPTISDLFLRRFIPENIKPFFRKRNNWYEMRDKGYDKIFEVPYATGCFMFFRFSILKQIGGFDENFFMYLEDADITRRTNQISKCVFYPYDSVEHLWTKGSHKSLKLTWINIKSAFYYFNKWGWRLW